MHPGVVFLCACSGLLVVLIIIYICFQLREEWVERRRLTSYASGKGTDNAFETSDEEPEIISYRFDETDTSLETGEAAEETNDAYNPDEPLATNHRKLSRMQKLSVSARTQKLSLPSLRPVGKSPPERRFTVPDRGDLNTAMKIFEKQRSVSSMSPPQVDTLAQLAQDTGWKGNLGRVPVVECDLTMGYEVLSRTFTCHIQSFRNIVLADYGGPSFLQITMKLYSLDNRKLKVLKSDFLELGSAGFQEPKFKIAGKYTWDQLKTMKIEIKVTGARKSNWIAPGSGFCVGMLFISLKELDLRMHEKVRMTKMLLPKSSKTKIKPRTN